jgi:hypothetical protein
LFKFKQRIFLELEQPPRFADPTVSCNSQIQRPVATKRASAVSGRGPFHGTEARGKKKTQVVAAVGRELLGFIWAIAVAAEAQQKAFAAESCQ